jgi:hypothetical protein
MMNLAKSSWASVQGDPVLMRPVNVLLTILWVALIPISMMMGWLNSLTASRGADHDAFSATPGQFGPALPRRGAQCSGTNRAG